MKRNKLFRMIFAGSLALVSALTVGTTAFAAKTKIADVSQYQGNINWSKASKSLKFAIIRVKHGNPGDSDYRIDTKRDTNANGAHKYGVPFGQYDYAEFDSKTDAVNDARQFYALSNKNARFYALDNEKRKSGVKGKEQTYVNTWLSTMRTLTNKPVIYYSYQNFVNVNKTSSSKFDGSWIANYSKKPSVPTDLWQYTSTGSLSGISGHVDLSRLVDSSTVSKWYKTTKATYFTSVKNGQKLRATRNINRYSTANLKGKKGSLKYNATVTAKAIVKSSGGTARIQLSDGSYITANKAYVQVK
ncbi:GH25 family lysozyme [Secundilactobacillus folii]|uniref:1,4-beta-N-acetylmuramidase n=1 Tax=Secundilactobacillus folii TaxID=2678357 RepID=A0A7X2XU94_9LACO|nr:GH25 family lysozyme [Secundilactobacillus folii]MTV81650.1 1,4-beta-N-acetylmuramidase [Secundilactobacillus folii]